MAIAIQLDFPGATLAQYDEVIDGMGFSRGGPAHPDAMFHWAAKTDDGIRVVDVWTSQEAFDRFAAEKIGPLTQKAGLAQPRVEVFQVHNYLVTP